MTITLSTWERTVLVAIANGWTNERIAKAHTRSLEAVKSAGRKIRAKLGARDRTHAVAIADRVGLLTVADVPLPPHLAPTGSAVTSRATGPSGTSSGSTSGRPPR